METNWQQIEEGELTHSSEHHLMAIHYLREEFGYARITDISNFLNITRGSVSITMNKLNEGKFITFDTNKHITLSPKGEKIVNGILNRRNVLKQFFSNVLMLKEEDAEKIHANWNMLLAMIKLSNDWKS